MAVVARMIARIKNEVVKVRDEMQDFQACYDPAFLLKVYGDAEDEEHIKLARVLQILLNFTPEVRQGCREHRAWTEAAMPHTSQPHGSKSISSPEGGQVAKGEYDMAVT